MKSKAVE